MPTAKIASALQIGGIAINSVISRTDEGQAGQEVTLPAASGGTLTTRTDDDTGVITLTAGHDIVTGKVDVYWADGVAYGMDAVVTVNSCTIDLGAGDNLPDAETVVTVANQVDINIEIVGDDLIVLALQSSLRSSVDLHDSGSSSLLALELLAAEAYTWATNGNVTNPVAGDVVDSIQASNGDSSADATLQIGVLVNTV